MQTILKVTGMSCEHCVAHVTKTLAALEGVTNVAVSLAENSATIEHSDAVTKAQMIEAIDDAGYEAE